MVTFSMSSACMDLVSPAIQKWNSCCTFFHFDATHLAIIKILQATAYFNSKGVLGSGLSPLALRPMCCKTSFIDFVVTKNFFLPTGKLLAIFCQIIILCLPLTQDDDLTK